MVTGIGAGGTVTVTLEFPDAVPTSSKYFKVNSSGLWVEIPFGSNNGDSRITLTLTDGDPLTDSDGAVNGTIDDPGAITVSATTAGGTPTSSSGSDSSGCFISNLFK